MSGCGSWRGGGQGADFVHFWVPFLDPVFNSFGATFGSLFLHFWDTFSLLEGGPFLDPVFISFGVQVWGPFLVLWGYFFAPGGDLGEAAFLKDLPCKILVFREPGAQESLQKEIPKRFQKDTPKMTDKSHISGLILVPFFA